MTAENRKRLILYSVALILIAGLAYGGFVYKARPEAATLVGSAEILAQTGLFDKAMESARQALEQEPENRYAHIILAHCLGQVGKYDQSVSHYRQAVALSDPAEPKTDSLKLYLAEMLIQAGHPAEAAKLAEGVLEVGESGGAYVVLAAARIAQNRFEDAESEYVKFAAFAPDDTEPLVLSALLMERLERSEDALAFLDQAVSLAPANPGVQLSRARVLAGLGREEAAVKALLFVAETQAVRMQRFLFAEEALAPLRTNERLLAVCKMPIETE